MSQSLRYCCLAICRRNSDFSRLQQQSSRSLTTTKKLNKIMKFNVTEDMFKKYEKEKSNEKIQVEEEKPKSLHAKLNPLIMGKVSSERQGRVIKVAIPKHRLNPALLLYRRDFDNILALDEDNQCKPGDWILLRRQPEPLDIDVDHKVERIVYSYGKYIDPLTNRRSLGLYYDDDMERLEKIKLEL